MYIIGIAGGSGSGKTTFAHKVLKQLKSDQAVLLHMDSYYLDPIPSELHSNAGKPNFDHPQAFDWALLREHIHLLKTGQAIQCPNYDFATSTRSTSTSNISPCRLLLFEGIFSLYDEEIRNLLDIKCFLHVDADIRFSRRLHRDVKERGRSLESVIAQYYETVRPMHQNFLEPQKQFADFTVGEETDIAANILAARLKELIHL